MADAEHLARDLAEALAERHVEVLECHLAEGVGVVALGHDDGRQSGAIGLGVAAQDLEAPGVDCRAGRLGVARVAGEDRVEPFLQQHVARLAEAVEQVGGGRGWEPAVGIGRQHLLPIPVGARRVSGLGSRQRFLADGVEGKAGRQHQALLGTRDGHVDTPRVVAIVDRAQRRDRVDQQQGRVPGGIDGLAHGADVGHHAGRCLVVDDAHSLDGMARIFLQAHLDGGGIGRLAPVATHEFRFDTKLVGHLLPERSEVAGFPHQYRVAGRQCVDEGGFPSSGTGCGIDDNRLFCLENLANGPQDLFCQRVELRPAVVDRRMIHRAQDAVGNVGRPRDLQEVTAAGM